MANNGEIVQRPAAGPAGPLEDLEEPEEQ